MMEIEQLIEKLRQKLPTEEIETKPHIGGKERIFVLINAPKIADAARAIKEMGGRLCTISCVERFSLFELIYHFSLDREGVMVNLKTTVKKTDPEVDSVTPIIRGAAFIEREIHDLFGVKFKGHPSLKRLILSEQWKGNPPLRRE
jgi:NADH-quinone oxidoreductase subunit C